MRAWRLRRQRHIGSSLACDSLDSDSELLAPHHARLLAPSGAAAFGRSIADDAASGRAGASQHASLSPPCGNLTRKPPARVDLQLMVIFTLGGRKIALFGRRGHKTKSILNFNPKKMVEISRTSRPWSQPHVRT